jgi:TDG/mug DNA glycosylase family protein
VWVLPDVVGPDPLVVFCGQAGAQSTRSREHRYETPGNSFHESLHLSGLVPRLLRPEEEHLLPTWGLGTTDLVTHREPDQAEWSEVDELARKVRGWEPEWLAVTGKGVAAELARAVGERPPGLGPAPFALGGCPLFVLPGTSGANRRHDYDGRPTRVAWWRDLAALVGRGDAAAPRTAL